MLGRRVPIRCDYATSAPAQRECAITPPSPSFAERDGLTPSAIIVVAGHRRSARRQSPIKSAPLSVVPSVPAGPDAGRSNGHSRCQDTMYQGTLTRMMRWLPLSNRSAFKSSARLFSKK